MYKVFSLIIVLVGVIISCYGQSDTSAIKEVVEMTSHFSNQENRLELHFDTEKETFVFSCYHGTELLKKLKLIKSDVHPEGIFLYESEDDVKIRFLSIHNGKVFVEEKFVNGFRKGRSTNVVDVGDLSHVERSTLLKYIENFKIILREPEKEKQPTLISPPRTKN